MKPAEQIEILRNAATCSEHLIDLLCDLIINHQPRNGK